MGCDIHLMAEHRVKRGATEKEDIWETLAPKKDAKSKDQNEVYGEWYDGRNYNLFGILANVRNGRGFAGIKTGDGFEPILPEDAKHPLSKPSTSGPFCRGVPKNASAGYKKSVRDYGEDGHSASWLTLTELETYAWKDKHSILYGVVGPSVYAAWKETGGEPVAYSGGVAGGGVIHVDNAEMDRLIAEGVIKPKPIPAKDDRRALMNFGDHEGTNPSYYTQVSWKESYAEAAGNFVTSTLPKLKAYATEHGIDHDDIRICFFFDN